MTKLFRLITILLAFISSTTIFVIDLIYQLDYNSGKPSLALVWHSIIIVLSIVSFVLVLKNKEPLFDNDDNDSKSKKYIFLLGEIAIAVAMFFAANYLFAFLSTSIDNTIFINYLFSYGVLCTPVSLFAVFYFIAAFIFESFYVFKKAIKFKSFIIYFLLNYGIVFGISTVLLLSLKAFLSYEMFMNIYGVVLIVFRIVTVLTLILIKFFIFYFHKEKRVGNV